MDLPPLTDELKAHLAVLAEMLESTSRVLHDYMEHHPGRHHHLGAETALLCQNLLKHLRHLMNRDEVLATRECHGILADLLNDADALDEMAARVHHDRADDRLAHALNILAESFRFAGPAILRWCHDFQGSVPSYHEALEQRRTRFLRTVKPLVQDLAAA